MELNWGFGFGDSDFYVARFKCAAIVSSNGCKVNKIKLSRQSWKFVDFAYDKALGNFLRLSLLMGPPASGHIAVL